MKHKAFIALVLVSLLIAAGLCCGYLARVSIIVTHVTQYGATLTVHETYIGAGDARFWATYAHGTLPGPIPSPLHPGLNMHGRIQPVHSRFLSLRQTVWKFDGHWMPAGAAGIQVFISAVPLWCLILPAMIAPSIWLYRRIQTHRQMRGFEVEQPPTPSILGFF